MRRFRGPTRTLMQQPPGYEEASAVAMANGRAYVQVGNCQSGGDALLAYDVGSFWAPALWQQDSGCGSPSPTVHLGIVFVGSIAQRRRLLQHVRERRLRR